MNIKNSLKLEMLTQEECLAINGGDAFMSNLGKSIGMIARCLWEFGSSSGGYAYAKCG
jgi:hypothetical protein